MNYSVEFAGQWHQGLREAIKSLSWMPRRHPIARENDRYDVEVRRLLYYGPADRRRSQAMFRILFHINEPLPQEKTGIVRILHVRHGARDEQAVSDI